jgi:hypothetical protein
LAHRSADVEAVDNELKRLTYNFEHDMTRMTEEEFLERVNKLTHKREQLKKVFENQKDE